MVHPYCSMDTAPVWKKSCFILLDRPDFYMIDSLLIVVHVFTMRMLTSLSVDEILLPRYVNLSTNIRGVRLLRSIFPTPLQIGEYGTRLNFQWIQTQDSSPETPGEHKNASSTIHIPLKKALGAPGDKTSPTKVD